MLDEQGRPVTATAPDGTGTSYTYDDGYSGSLPYFKTTVTDTANHATINYADIWGRSVMVDAPDGPSVGYTYDVSDRLVGVTYGTAVTTLTYDLAGRKTQMTDPDMGTWYYRYNALGELVQQQDARTQRVCLYYDDLGRLTGKYYSLSDCPTTPPPAQDMNVRYWYDDYSDAAIFYDYSGSTTYAIGQRTGMLDASGHSMWAYDERGRLIREEKVVLSINGGTFVTRWGYNSADLPAWMKYPVNNIEGEGETVYNTYYPQLAVDRVYGTGVYVDNTDYDAAGRVDRRMLGASPFITQDYVYNAWNVQGGRLAQLKTGYSTVSDSLQDLRYTYDLSGNVLTISDYKAGGTQSQTFTYDTFDRLVSAVASGGTGGTYSLQNYTYNPDTGNLASNAGVSYTYGNNAHKHAVTSTTNGNSYSYDANGNQTTRTVGGQTYTLSYDAENRLVSVSGAVSASFVYDGDGNRVTSTIATTNTVYINGYFEWSGSSSTMRKYYYAGGQRIAMRLGTTTLRFLLGDHLGSTAITATTTGSKLAELRYYPWGGVRYTYGTTPTDYRFTGQQELSSIGLYNYGARFYDPYLNRWINPDSIVPVAAQGTQAFDRYAYTNNNPVRYTDPTGHLLCSEVPWEEDCDPNADAQIISLARRGGLTDDGEHMLQLYLRYRRITPGWWNEDGDFTLDEFLGLTLYYEYADTPSDGSGYFTEAVGRKLSWWCNYTGCTNDTASTLNYIGTRAVMRSRYAENEYNDISLEDLTQPNYGIVSFYDAIGMAQTAASNPAWKSGAVGYNDPWDWGNLSMLPVDARIPMTQINEFNLTSSSIVYRYGVDPYTAFVIVTFNQETYWKSYTAR